jgi:type IV secretory pathway TraG/TraD family ATPase VirD4
MIFLVTWIAIAIFSFIGSVIIHLGRIELFVAQHKHLDDVEYMAAFWRFNDRTFYVVLGISVAGLLGYWVNGFFYEDRVYLHTWWAYAIAWLLSLASAVYYPSMGTAPSRSAKIKQRKPSVSIDGFDNLLHKNGIYWDVSAGLPEPMPLIAFKDDANNHQELAEHYNFTEDQMKWGDNRINLWGSKEDRGLVLGAPGSGKTSLLVAQAVEWMKTGESLVLTDIKPEIFGLLKGNGLFERYGYEYYVINPTDVASHHYNMFGEIERESDYNEILNVLIPASTDGDSAVFTDNARRLLKAILMHLDGVDGYTANLADVRRFMNSCDDLEELFTELKRSENESVAMIAKDILRMGKNERLLASVQSQLSLALQFLDVQAIRVTTSNNDFSLREVLQKKRQCVVLQYDQAEKNTTAPLFGAMVAYILRILQMNYQKRGSVLLLLDEIINCAPIPKFTETLNLMRSTNVPTFLYLQSLEGLNRVYGDNADKLFNGACNLKISYRIFDEVTQKYFSDLVGKNEVTYTGMNEGSSSTRGASGEKESNSSTNSSGQSVTVALENIIEPEEFSRLATGEAVVMYDGHFGRLKMPMYFNDYPMNRSKIARMSDLDEPKVIAPPQAFKVPQQAFKMDYTHSVKVEAE